MFFTKKFFSSTILGLTLGVFLAGYAVFAYTPPTVAPPGGNAPAPVNIGSGSQVKSGGLWVGSLGVDGGARLGGDIRWTGSLTGGSVPWERLTSVPSTSSRWPSWDEVSGKPTGQSAHVSGGVYGYCSESDAYARGDWACNGAEEPAFCDPGSRCQCPDGYTNFISGVNGAGDYFSAPTIFYSCYKN